MAELPHNGHSLVWFGCDLSPNFQQLSLTETQMVIPEGTGHLEGKTLAQIILLTRYL